MSNLDDNKWTVGRVVLVFLAPLTTPLGIMAGIIGFSCWLGYQVYDYAWKPAPAGYIQEYAAKTPCLAAAAREQLRNSLQPLTKSDVKELASNCTEHQKTEVVVHAQDQAVEQLQALNEAKN
ncbi:hypothetical protein GSG79_004248 [Escherichia coli]|nr:hypothetical protein [Escherichia coli]